MLSKADIEKKVGAVEEEESSNGHKLLNEVQAISKALYLDKNPKSNAVPATYNAPSKSLGKTHLLEPQKEKKSIWNWPLRALSHVRNRRFNCCFSLLVHSVEGLPPSFSDICLIVHWRRRDESLSTRPARVLNGIADFEEKLTYTCSVYGCRNGPHHSAKYEARHFLVYASVLGSPEVELGKHRIDLTRLLPLTLEELQDEKSSGKWSTAFQLSGKAKGATLNVSFGYTVIGDNHSAVPSGNAQNVRGVSNVKQNTNNMGMARTISSTSGKGNSKATFRRHESLRSTFEKGSHAFSHSVEEIKDLHEVLPASKSDLVSSVNILYQKFDEEKMDPVIESSSEFDEVTKQVDLVEWVPPAKVDGNAHESGEPLVTGHEKEVLLKEFKKDGDVPKVRSEEVVEVSPTESPSEEGIKQVDLVESVPPAKVDGNAHESGEPLVIGHEKEVLLKEFKKDGDVPKVRSEEVVEVNTTKSPAEEGIKVSSKDDGTTVLQGDKQEQIHDTENDVRCTREILMEELESALNNATMLETAALDAYEHQENHTEAETSCATPRKETASRNLKDITESVASEFLNMLGIEHSPFGLSSESEPDSPRERLLREFEKEALATGSSLFEFDEEEDLPQAECDNNPEEGSASDFQEDFDLASIIHDIEEEYQMETQAMMSRPKAKVLEDLESEALMREWGLNERTFQNSPPHNRHATFQPADFPIEEPLELPSLGEGLGPFVQTKNGGFLRSMNPSLFRDAKASGSLIMQVSTPVVVPAEMGSGITEMLQRLAAVGIEKLSMQANKLMPLDDITGKTIQEVVWEASPALEGAHRDYRLERESDSVMEDASAGLNRTAGRASSEGRPKKFNSTSGNNDIESECVSLEDLAPLAMDKIEALSLEGLRIQSGMSDEDAPLNITAQSIGEFSALQVKSDSLGLEGAAGLQLLDVKDNGDDVDGLMGLSLSLDEWMKLDSGDIGDEDEISEHTSKILAAHHANSLDFIRQGSKGERRKGKSGRKCGLLGNNFTVALMVQLRDPLRNYEPVGAPMLSLIQVERVFVPPKPRIYSTVSELREENEEEEEDSEKPQVGQEVKDDETMEERIPQYKVTEVHLAGIKTEPDKKKPWGSTAQQQSGSRWLIANGMGKGNKNPFMKSKSVSTRSSSAPSTTKVQPRDSLWSITSRPHSSGSKWIEPGKFSSHRRNPNVILPKETMRLL